MGNQYDMIIQCLRHIKFVSFPLTRSDRYRGLGLAKQLIKRLEEEARNIGFQEVYLQSGSAANFYRNLGYKEIETVKTKATAAGTETLFIKKISAG